MSGSNVRPIKKVPGAKSEMDLNKLPINVINARLGEARATLDLIHTGLQDGCFVESLYDHTLAYAVNGVILRIEEALEAADAPHSELHSLQGVHS